MKRNKSLLKIAALTTAFAIGVSIFSSLNVSSTRVVAEPHADNYALYTYSGNYYNDIDFNAGDGMNGNLRKALTNLIIPEKFYTYSGGGSTHLSGVLQSADEDPTNSNNMIYLYTRNSVTKTAATVNNVIIWNREHVWCQSLSNGNWGTDDGGTDILHLRPAYGSTNSSRGNTPYGNSGKATRKIYNGMDYGYTGNGYFEPLDSVKGDVARIIMYVWTTYTGYKNYKPLDILNVFESYDTLLSWHTADKPDVMEGNRNNYAQSSWQKNRNPFVDHPELAWKIFGDNASSAVKNACMEAYPASSGETIDATAISINKTSATVEEEQTLQLSAALTPSNATSSITWSSSDESVATVSSGGLVTTKVAGSATITATANGHGVTCALTVVEPADRTTLFLADLTDTPTVNNDCTITSLYMSGKTGFYQDGSTADRTGYFRVRKASPLFSFEPSKITFRAYLGSGDNRDPLVNNVMVCLIDSSNNEIDVTRTVVTTKITTTMTEYTAVIPYSENAYGLKLYHTKAAGHNIRYYSFALYRSNSEPEPQDYLNFASTIINIFGNETSTLSAMSNSVTFSSKMEDQQVLTSGIRIGQVVLTGDKGEHLNTPPKYFANGTALRLYAGNTLTFTAAHNISSVRFTFKSGYGTNDIVSSDDASLSGSTWECNSNSVTFSFSENSRLTSVTVTYTGQEITSLINVALGFGAKIPQLNWDRMASKWTISDYGFMLVKENTMLNTYNESSVEEVLMAEKAVATVHTGNGNTPYLNNGNYYFTMKVNILDTSDYDTVYCAAPFIVVNSQYYFLDEMRYSVRELAEYCLNNGGSSLSDVALEYLVG